MSADKPQKKEKRPPKIPKTGSNWTSNAAHGWHHHARSMFELRNRAAGGIRSEGQVPALRFRFALLQTVRVFRYGRAI